MEMARRVREGEGVTEDEDENMTLRQISVCQILLDPSETYPLEELTTGKCRPFAY